MDGFSLVENLSYRTSSVCRQTHCQNNENYEEVYSILCYVNLVHKFTCYVLLFYLTACLIYINYNESAYTNPLLLFDIYNDVMHDYNLAQQIDLKYKKNNISLVRFCVEFIALSFFVALL